jgi:predicted RNase H-like HicB family nuclease
MDIRFDVSPCDDTGGFVARWDDPVGGGMCTQGESIADLEAMVRDAVEGYFATGAKPRRIQLHFVEDPLLVLA